MLKKVFAATVLFSAMNASAADFSYGHFDIGFASVDVDDEGESYSGEAISLDFAAELGSVFYVTAGFATADVEETSQDTKSLGVGVHAPLGERVDVYAEVAYVSVDVEFDGWSFDDTGSSQTLGLRSKVADRIELGGGITRLSVFDTSDTGYFVNAFFAAKENVHFGGEISRGDDSTGYGVILRVSF